MAWEQLGKVETAEAGTGKTQTEVEKQGREGKGREGQEVSYGTERELQKSQQPVSPPHFAINVEDDRWMGPAR